jgi:hypothetical protein
MKHNVVKWFPSFQTLSMIRHADSTELKKLSLELVWESQQAIRTLSNRNRVTLLCVLATVGFRALKTLWLEGTSSPFLGPETVVPFSSFAGGTQE